MAIARYFLFLVWLVALPAAEIGTPSPKDQPRVAPASDEAELAIKRFRAPRGFKIELVAAEPLLANPVAFCFDEQGRIYVVETFRHGAGVLDIRGRRGWPAREVLDRLTPAQRENIGDAILDEDLASRTVEQRTAMLQKYFGPNFDKLARESDRVRLIWDDNQDGKGDRATVFATGFDDATAGIGAGVFARRGDVWFANIPDLWYLRDQNGDGIADVKKSLHRGFGVRVGFLGHDLHGLCLGFDGKLYFSVGDRGAFIRTKDNRTVSNPDTGAIYRCNQDGSELEIFASGLRNPQELAFDQFGNLWTGDNNSDGGDKARWVYAVEGSDSGWRIGYQFFDSPRPRGPWNSEKLWHPRWKGQAAYIVPPVTNITSGPSGLAYYPGTGLPDKYQEHFFLCDFHGGKGSGIHSFAVQPQGAGFTVTDHTEFLWEVLPTDVEFGPDGGIYYSDWVAGWNKTGKGRIYRVFDPVAAEALVVAETRALLAQGLDSQPTAKLAAWLQHPDLRVRREAQFALVNRGAGATLEQVARSAASGVRARLHGIWGIGQLTAAHKAASSRTKAAWLEAMVNLLNDPELEVRAQAAQLLGDRRAPSAYPALEKLLRDPAPRVQFHAALAIGKLGNPQAVPGLFEMLRADQSEDPYLRHASVMSLVRLATPKALAERTQDSSLAVRLAAVVALRRMERPEVAAFLSDPDAAVVREAARAINDQPIPAAGAALAALIEKPNDDDPIARRVLNANFRLGHRARAEAVGRFALNDAIPAELRAEAVAALGDWSQPSGRDRVTGEWRPLGVREAAAGEMVLANLNEKLVTTAPIPVRLATLNAIRKLNLVGAARVLVQLVGDVKLPADFRGRVLMTLADLNAPQLPEAIRVALPDANDSLRSVATKLQARLEPQNAANRLPLVLENGSQTEKQAAFGALATMRDPSAGVLLAQWLDKLLAGKVPRELEFDLVEAAAKHEELKDKLRLYETQVLNPHPLGAWRPVLWGGDPAAGRKTFFEKAEAACLRCHKVSGEGGEVGPDLTGIANRQTREYLLESVLMPNKHIAPGFESVMVKQKDGTVYAGIVKSESTDDVILNSPEDGLLTIKKTTIQSRERGLSAMPEGIQNILTREELRDLLAFLTSLK